MKKITLLLIEDEEAIRDMLRFSLPRDEFNIFDAENTLQGMRILDEHIPDLIIVDWMLPGKSGIDFIKWIKQKDLFKTIPIIMLTARAEEENKIKGLMTGADDYVTKPFSPNELIARIKTVLRRGILKANAQIEVGNIILNTDRNSVTIKKRLIDLSPIEYKMLHFFMSHPNKTYTRDQLITFIWGATVYIDDRTVDALIRRLRSKLQPYAEQDRIKTVRSVGYFFEMSANEKK